MSALGHSETNAIARHIGRLIGDVDLNPAVQAERERIAQHLEMLADRPDTARAFAVSAKLSLRRIAKHIRSGAPV